MLGRYPVRAEALQRSGHLVGRQADIRAGQGAQDNDLFRAFDGRHLLRPDRRDQQGRSSQQKGARFHAFPFSRGLEQTRPGRNMPGLSGLELLRRLIEIDPHARVLVFSMHSEPVYAARVLEIGARGYLSKNASPEELRTAISRVLSGSAYVQADLAQQLVVLPHEQRQNLSERVPPLRSNPNWAWRAQPT